MQQHCHLSILVVQVLHVAVMEELSSTLATLLSRSRKNGTEEDVSRFVNMLNRLE